MVALSEPVVVDPQLVPLVVVGGLTGFVLLWCFVSLVAARASGWSRLAASVRWRDGDGRPERWRAVPFAEMGRGARYKGALRLGADGEHLYLRMVFVFRPGHPPLALPWREVRARVDAAARPPRTHRSVGRLVRFELGGEDGVPLLVPESVAREVLADAGAPLPS